MPVQKARRDSADRAEPGRLVMAEAVPFALRYTYHTNQPIEQVLRPDFFLPVRDQLRAGDTIRIVETDTARHVVKRYIDVMVIAGGRHPTGVLLHVEHGLVELAETEPEQTSQRENLSVKHRGRGRWAICRGSKPVETGFASRAEAETALADM
ncbi:MAG: hypothetical protein RIM72_00655 [Alphaproteobacteria bacterium]